MAGLRPDGPGPRGGDRPVHSAGRRESADRGADRVLPHPGLPHRRGAGWADLLAAEASTVVAAAQFGRSDEPVSQRVREMLQSRETIAQAQGVIMQRDGVAATAASAVLRGTSRRTGRPLRDVAAECLASIRDGAAPRGNARAGTGAAAMAVRGYVRTALGVGVKPAPMSVTVDHVAGVFAALWLPPRSAQRRMPA